MNIDDLIDELNYYKNEGYDCPVVVQLPNGERAEVADIDSAFDGLVIYCLEGNYEDTDL